MTTTVTKCDGGLSITVPPSVAEEAGLVENSVVDVTFSDGAVIAKPRRKPKYTLEEMLSKITPETLHPETDWGPPVGKEVW